MAHALDVTLPASLADNPVRFDWRQADDLAQLCAEPAGMIRLVSLLPYVDDIDRPWSEIERELQASFSDLAETGDPVFIVTVFRSLDAFRSPEGQARLIRIRRLNLLATELSREHGAFVIDLDRALADIGGLVLKTDYRLEGELAAEVAGREIALNMAGNGLDDYLPFEAQETAREAILNQQSSIRPTSSLSPSDIIALGKGRSRQRIMMNTDAQQENHAGWLVSQALKGRIAPKEAAQRLLGAMQRRGPREIASLLVTGVRNAVTNNRHAR